MSKSKKGIKDKLGQLSPDEDLVVEPLETENWKLCIVIATGTDWHSDEVLSAIIRHISNPGIDYKVRRKFHAMSYQELIKRAQQGGADTSSRQSGKVKIGG